MDFLKFLGYTFRFTADAFHVFSIYILISKIHKTKSCSGLSYKTQLLYLFIFLTRYFDLFFVNVTNKLRLYNFLMKLIFIFSQLYIIFLINKYSYTYDKRLDNFDINKVMLILLVISFFLKDTTKGVERYVREYLWTFSVLLECLAIVPQLLLLQETGEAEILTSTYIVTLGAYRLFYVFSWIVKTFRKEYDFFLMATGAVQSLVYFNFFVLYYKHWRSGTKKIPL